MDWIGQRYGITPAAQVGITDLYTAFCFNEAAALSGLDAERRVRDKYDKEHGLGDYAEGGSKWGNVLRPDGSLGQRSAGLLPRSEHQAGAARVPAVPNTAEIHDTPDGPIIFGTVPFIGKDDRRNTE